MEVYGLVSQIRCFLIAHHILGHIFEEILKFVFKLLVVFIVALKISEKFIGIVVFSELELVLGQSFVFVLLLALAVVLRRG